MDPSCSSTPKYEDQERDLRALLDTFNPICSLEEIASAYCRAGRDIYNARKLLCELQESKSNQKSHEHTSEMYFAPLESPLDEDSIDSSALSCSSKLSKSKKLSASVGSVSGFLGKAYSRPSSSKKDSSVATKPLKFTVPESLQHELGMEPDLSDFVPGKVRLNDKDTEDFLFSMLGDGFRLSKDTIREVLGHCGYDVKMGVQELLALSVKKLDNGKAIKNDTVQDVYVVQDSIQASGPDKERPNLSRDLSMEVLVSLFHAPDRSEEEPKRKILEWGLNRTRVVGQKAVTKPPDDISSSSLSITARIQPDISHDNEDTYQFLRRAVKQHWDTMKAYYEAAIDAFARGDRSRANYLLEQGKYYNKMAREADEKSAGEILETRKTDVQNEVTLDLHDHYAKEAVRLLKLHLRSLANIPSFSYLKVIVDTDAEDLTKGKRKRLILKLLERESIKWTEEDGNSGTILIRLDEIHPHLLSFAVEA